MAVDWQAKFEKLAELRETDAENNASQMQTAMQQLKQTSDNLIQKLNRKAEEQRLSCSELVDSVNLAAQLQQQNAELRENLTIAESKLSKNCPQQESGDAQGEAQRKVLERTVEMYRIMTGIHLSAENAGEFTCKCAGTNSRTAEFRMKLEENGQLAYTPLASTNGVELEDYMQDEITFDASYAPSFTHKLFAALVS